ncbi:MAG: hypothetical protein II193_00495 [Lachnospiraceae bacterium]|nr:hypothetical protein [Lachnospiraceae bacterium]
MGSRVDVRLNNKWNTLVTLIMGIMLALTFIIYIFVYKNGTFYLHIKEFCVTGLSIGIDRFRGMYGFICTLIWFVALVFARGHMMDIEHPVRFYTGTLITYIATLGIFYSNNLGVVYILFEVMSICSYIWVANDQNDESKKAASTYLIVSVFSGLVMLMGAVVLHCSLGTLEYGEMRNAVLNMSERKPLYIGAGCLLFGFCAKAGAFPMQFYLHSAYPATPAPAAAILSAALTKAGIFGIIILTLELFTEDSNWAVVLIILGTVTMFINALLGIFQVDIMNILACSSVSQLGFIILGCGLMGILNIPGVEEYEEAFSLALQGTVLYMVNHSLFKLILFIACGYLCRQAGSRILNDLRGTGKNNKGLLLPILTGCAGLAGIPLFSGYISKTLLHESIVELIHILNGNITVRILEWIFLITGGLTFAYVSKIFVILFIDRNNNTEYTKEDREPLIIWIPTVISLVCGILPYALTNKLADIKELFDIEYHMHLIKYFSLVNLKGSMISITFGVLLYLLLVRPYLCRKNILPEFIDSEKYIWKPLFKKVLVPAGEIFAVGLDSITPILQKLVIVFMSILAFVMDSIVPYIYNVGMAVLGKAAEFYNALADFAIAVIQGTIFNPSKHVQLKRNEKLEISLHHMSMTGRVIQASLSFGFLMLCMGLCITLLYLLLGH